MDSFGKYLDSTREFITNSHKCSWNEANFKMVILKVHIYQNTSSALKLNNLKTSDGKILPNFWTQLPRESKLNRSTQSWWSPWSTLWQGWVSLLLGRSKNLPPLVRPCGERCDCHRRWDGGRLSIGCRAHEGLALQISFSQMQIEDEGRLDHEQRHESQIISVFTQSEVCCFRWWSRQRVAPL